jgi:hypothetical protein
MLWHSEQLQLSQYSSAAKHSQYSFKHLDFLQLQGLRFDAVAGEAMVFSLPDDGVGLAVPGVVPAMDGVDLGAREAYVGPGEGLVAVEGGGCGNDCCRLTKRREAEEAEVA